MTRNEKTCYVCNKDYHPKVQFCPRKECMNKADFKKKMTEKRKKDGNLSHKGYSYGFKVGLVGFTSAEKYKSVEDQFFS